MHAAPSPGSVDVPGNQICARRELPAFQGTVSMRGRHGAGVARLQTLRAQRRQRWHPQANLREIAPQERKVSASASTHDGTPNTRELAKDMRNCYARYFQRSELAWYSPIRSLLQLYKTIVLGGIIYLRCIVDLDSNPGRHH